MCRSYIYISVRIWINIWQSMFHKEVNGRCGPVVNDKALPSVQYRNIALCRMVIKLHDRRTHTFDLASLHANITANVNR